MSLLSAAALAVAAVSVSSEALAQRNRGQATTAVVINYQRVAAESVLGRDLQAKLVALRQQFQTEAQALQPEQQSLQQERERLAAASRNMTQQQIQNSSTLAPQFQQFQQRLQQLEGRARGLEGDMQCSQLIAMRDFDRQVSPIVQSVMTSRGAGIVIDASNTTSFDPNFEITTTVIQQLDQNQNSRVANVTRHAASECQAQQPAAQ
ncbi:MAG: OmpH family outer membrane protein [Hyphomonadaceae bacterium]|nr:OmpH family outer membrane protein [Hyphomonadaceae bacterium]MCA8885575.1 OmpH family outer membrane protein [Hyphomonadaceae bacterium]